MINRFAFGYKRKDRHRRIVFFFLQRIWFAAISLLILSLRASLKQLTVPVLAAIHQNNCCRDWSQIVTLIDLLKCS